MLGGNKLSSVKNLYLDFDDGDVEELDTSSGCDMSFETSSDNVAPISPLKPPPTIHAPRKLFGSDDDEVRESTSCSVLFCLLYIIIFAVYENALTPNKSFLQSTI